MTILLTHQDIENIIRRHMEIQSSTMNGPKVQSVAVTIPLTNCANLPKAEAIIRFEDPKPQETEFSQTLGLRSRHPPT